MKENVTPYVLGPFESKSHLGLIAVTGEFLYIFKLKFNSTFKFALNRQIPFLFSSHFENLIETPIPQLISEYDSDKLKIDEQLIIEIRKSKYWKHTININSGNFDLRWNLLDRYRVDSYIRRLGESIQVKEL